MIILYLDLNMGAAGDMLTAALYELLDDEKKKDFLEKINAAGIPGVQLVAEGAVKCGITGTHMKVLVQGQEEESHDHEHHHEHGPSTGSGTAEHEHHHYHASMEDIENIIKGLNLSDKVKENAVQIYKLIAAAESKAHGRPVSEIHFHEVGTMDAIADVTGVCLLLEMLAPQKIYASPVHVGSGHVHCAHGILPVPAPATATILQGIPIYGGQIQGELCTPTGAAILKYFVNEFGQMPCLTVEKTGYGMGKKDFQAANCLRAFLGQQSQPFDEILEFTCNLDDISAERVGFAIEELFAAGALEAYTIPVTMKKSRPGLLLCVMCHESDKDKIIQSIFKHTTTLGIRQNISKRYGLDRHIEKLDTKYGQVRVKCSQGYGVSRKKIEYEDLARLAREKGKSIQEIADEIGSL
ncbi:MAG: nickel pincer cofactor biosynthesis protein LarC [Treponema sp.]|nr:nickel pincer cofactor biosynthesis protein LarC [Treponema sp.]